jgi:NADPH2:quinone reductase
MPVALWRYWLAYAVNIRIFYLKDLSLYSNETMQYNAVTCASILRELVPGFASGELVPPPIHPEIYSLQDANAAYAKVGGVKDARIAI